MVDIRKLYGETGMFTYDPGFTSTASCQSAITYIDGDEGILLHRGYPIDQLAEQSSFMEVAYLLLHGDLPKQKELDEFTYTISRHTMLHEQLATFYRGFRRDAHPMAIMCGVVGALSRLLPRQHRHHRPAAAADRLAPADRQDADDRGDGVQIFDRPAVPLSATTSLSYTGNFLRMTFGVPAEPYEVNPIVEKAMDRIFILHADHEQNASTSTVRLAGSSGANPFACIAAGIACLWGPAHGGANEAALNMLREIGDVKRIPEYIARAKDKNDPFRLMGFGHRVYKNYDPRAKVMQQTADEVLKELNISDPVLDVARELEQIALNDDYFIEKKLYPNVDFYSGIILNAIGFPTEMFTALFALARTVGWVAQWNEMISDPEQKIGRPRQLYVGATQRDYVPVKEALERHRSSRAIVGNAAFANGVDSVRQSISERRMTMASRFLTPFARSRAPRRATRSWTFTARSTACSTTASGRWAMLDGRHDALSPERRRRDRPTRAGKSTAELPGVDREGHRPSPGRRHADRSAARSADERKDDRNRLVERNYGSFTPLVPACPFTPIPTRSTADCRQGRVEASSCPRAPSRTAASGSAIGGRQDRTAGDRQGLDQGVRNRQAGRGCRPSSGQGRPGLTLRPQAGPT